MKILVFYTASNGYTNSTSIFACTACIRPVMADTTTSSATASPIEVEGCACFAITPFGIFCVECQEPLENTVDSIRMHISRNKHQISNDTQVSEIHNKLNVKMKQMFGSLETYDPWIIKHNIKTFSCSCGKNYKDKRCNLTRHLKNIESKKVENGLKHFEIRSQSVFTSCQRMIDKRTLEQIRQQFTPKHECMNDILGCIPLKRENSAWIKTSLASIRNIFMPYKLPNERLEPYLPSLKLLVINTPTPVVSTIIDDLVYLDKQLEPNESTLGFFLGCIHGWVKNYCREHVNLLNGKVRYGIHSFFDESSLGNGGYNQTFNMRENEDVIWSEMKLVVTLSWRICKSSRCNSDLLSLLNKLEESVVAIEQRHRGIVTDSAIEEMISSLTIQQYLYCIFIEEQSNA